jgi:hypothetical protein
VSSGIAVLPAIQNQSTLFSYLRKKSVGSELFDDIFSQSTLSKWRSKNAARRIFPKSISFSWVMLDCLAAKAKPELTIPNSSRFVRGRYEKIVVRLSILRDGMGKYRLINLLPFQF